MFLDEPSGDHVVQSSKRLLLVILHGSFSSIRYRMSLQERNLNFFQPEADLNLGY